MRETTIETCFTSKFSMKWLKRIQVNHRDLNYLLQKKMKKEQNIQWLLQSCKKVWGKVKHVWKLFHGRVVSERRVQSFCFQFIYSLLLHTFSKTFFSTCPYIFRVFTLQVFSLSQVAACPFCRRFVFKRRRNGGHKKFLCGDNLCLSL